MFIGLLHRLRCEVQNRVRIEALAPNRGLILDRRGRVLAENLPAYQLELIPEQVPDLQDTLQRLAALDLVDSEDIPRISELSRSGLRFKPVTLRFNLSDDEIDLIRRWIQQGAEWPDDSHVKATSKADGSWWSLQPTEQIDPPELSFPQIPG